MLQMLLGNLAQVRFQVEAQFSDHVHFSYIMTWRVCWEAGHVAFYLYHTCHELESQLSPGPPFLQLPNPVPQTLLKPCCPLCKKHK